MGVEKIGSFGNQPPRDQIQSLTDFWFKGEAGWVGATFNHLPQVGLRGRMGYAIGYNGTGVAMSAYLGRALARRMLGQPGGETGLDQVKFETRPLFNGQTWYRRPVLAWHDLKDRLPSRGATIG